MTFLEIYEKYNLTQKEVHTLKVMKCRNLTKVRFESGINIDSWFNMIKDGILVVDSYSAQGGVCKVADFVNE